MSNDIHDQELLARCVSNEDPGAWELFVRKYSNLIWGSLHKTFRSYSFHYSPEDIEDAYSTVFLSLVEHDFKKLRQFEGRNACTLSTWLAVVAVRKAIDHMRKQKKHFHIISLEDESRLLDSIADKKHNIETLLMEQQTSAALEKMIAALTPKEKQLYDLQYRNCLSPEETAEALKISVTSFYTRKHRLIEKMKKMMQGL